MSILTDNLVSIILPTYNASLYLVETLESILNQKYEKWELIIVDDFSTDNTRNIIEKYTEIDTRIIAIYLNTNQGAAVARNRGIEEATGEFIAFIDSDDIWLNNKLEKQIPFMIENDYKFTCTSYLQINNNGQFLGIEIKPHIKMDYNLILRRCPGNSTIIYNAKSLGKVTIPNIRRRNDFVMWLKVIRKADFIHGLREPLTLYRVHTNSLSSNKKNLIKYQWIVYRKIENLSLIKSAFLLIDKIIQTALLNFKIRLSRILQGTIE